MQTFQEMVKFEICYQIRSPFCLGAVLVFALVHFLAFTGVINLDVGALVAINSGYAVLQNEVVLFILGMLPVIAVVTTAIHRDFEFATAPLVYGSHIDPRVFALGRFLGALSVASLIGLAGLLGALIGTFMPWLDQARSVPFSLVPWIYVYFVVILPGTLVLCAVFFGVAALTRSVALTWSLALAFFAANLLLNVFVKPDIGNWIALSDPSARLAVMAETRYWTAVELNTRLPWGVVLQNRVLWTTVALAVVLVTLRRFRLDLETAGNGAQGVGKRGTTLLQSAFPRLRGRTEPPPVIGQIAPAQNFSALATLAQLIAQLKMDLSFVCTNPVFYLFLALGMLAVVTGFASDSGLADTRPYPLTSLMLPTFRYGLGQYAALIGLYYSAELVHRERTARLSGIILATPVPEWLMVVSKTAAICLIVNALLLVAMLTSIALQAAMGFNRFELSVYLQSAFVYNSASYCMVCVLGAVIQSVVQNRWFGLLLAMAAYVGILGLGLMGFDHPLYSFGVPEVPYSDMNGFGHFSKPALALIAYWGTFCVLLLIAAHLFYPRGNHFSWAERVRLAKTRISRSVKLTGALAWMVFIASGGWIYYNTNILNKYELPSTRLAKRAGYEKTYGRYENAPAPSYDSINLELDLYPGERRLASRGRATLTNHKQETIREFVVSVKPLLRVDRLEVENAVRAKADVAQGFYLFRPNTPLAPGASIKLTWSLTRSNEGFVAAEPDNALVANGTYLDTLGVMPIPGYDDGRRITDNAERKKYGLAPRARMAKLGDPAYADKIGLGVDSRSAFAVVLSTSADQIAVAPGVLLKQWQREGRRYFHYKAEEPILPNLSFCSARFAVARDRWKNVALEIYYDPKHAFNIAAMMETAKRGLAMYSSEFAPYPYTYLRILEYPNYRAAAKFHSGTVPFSEATGFVNDLHTVENGDYGVMHELAHMWWGERITGAQMQGRWMLTENMADYSATMLFKNRYSAAVANRLVRGMLEGYLKGRRDEDENEVPVMLTENHGYLRAKGPHVLYALQDIIGKEKVHQALRNFLRDHSFRTSPCPTSRDLVNALRAEAGPEYQKLITDLFERIVLYDLQVDAANAKEVGGEYETMIAFTAKQFVADSHGNETEEPLDSWFDVALFADAGKPVEARTPLYIQKHRLRSGTHTLRIRTMEKPAIVALDPFRKMIERSVGNNSRAITGFPQ